MRINVPAFLRPRVPEVKLMLEKQQPGRRGSQAVSLVPSRERREEEIGSD